MKNTDRKLAVSLHDQGKSYAELAEMFGVNRNTIARIVKEAERKKSEYEKRNSSRRI